MARSEEFDWDPRSNTVQHDQIAAYDFMREHCPVARSRHGYTSVFRRADILEVLRDLDRFSSAVSRHVAIPNGMDPPEHAAFRRLIHAFFTADRMAEFEPACREICVALSASLPKTGDLEVMADIA